MTDEKKARRVIDFIQCLRHTKGEFHGKPFKLLPWQEKIIREFSLWADTPECDMDGLGNFYKLQQLAYLGYLMNLSLIHI